MAILKLALSLLKKHKAYAMTIFCLSLIVSLMLTAVLTVINRTANLQNDSFSSSKSPDFMVFLLSEDYDFSLSSKLSARDEVKSVRESVAVFVIRQEILFAGAAAKNEVGSFGQEGLYILPYQIENGAFKIKGRPDQLENIGKGEIILPLLYENQYSLIEGDIINITGIEFKILGFFEDPYFGSPMVGTRRVFVNSEDFKLLNTTENRSVGCLFIDLNSQMGDHDYGENLRSLTSNAFYGEEDVFVVTKAEIRQFAMLVPDLVAAILFAFTLLSLVITLYVLRYAVLSGVEGNYVTLGVFKAIGFIGRQIRIAIMLKYALICAIGAVLGVFLSIPAIPLFGGILMDAAGLIWSGSVWLSGALLVIVAIFALIGLITFMNTNKIKKISPVRAISFGHAPVYFAKRLNLSLKRLSCLPLNLKMALKQMLTRRKQYTVLLIIATLLAFMVILMGSISGLFDNDDTALYVFGNPQFDFSLSVRATDDDGDFYQKFDELTAEFAEKYDAVVYDIAESYTVLENTRVALVCFEPFDGIGMIEPLKGRFPQYENELALSPVMELQFEKTIGDTVIITKPDGEEVPFIVVGIVQSIRDIGVNSTIGISGAKRLNPDFSASNRGFILPANLTVKERETIVDEVIEKYESDDFSVMSKDVFFGQLLDSIRAVLSPATAVAYALAVVLVALITFLLSMIAIYRENTDIGIFKSIGFTSGQLRIQFALRFLLISLIGGLFGIILNLVAGNYLLSLIFGLFGVPKVSLSPGAFELMFPVVLVSIIALLAAFLVSGRIKQVSGRVLVAE